MRLILLVTAAAVFAAPSLHAQAWKLLQFAGTESFEFTLTQTTKGVEQTGRLALAMNATGAQPTATIEASVGDASCAATIPMINAQAVAPMMMMQCAVIAPIAIAMFAPTWTMFMGQQWTIGARMNMSQGGNGVSFEINETCSYAGQSGLLAKIRTNDMEVDTCVDPEIPLPLMVRFHSKSDDQTIHAVMTRFGR